MKKKSFYIIIISILITTSLFASESADEITKNNGDELINNSLFNTVLIRVDTINENNLPTKNFEIVGGQLGKELDILISQYELNKFDQAGIDYSIIINNFNEYMNSYRGQYHTLAEVEGILEDIADTFPDITSLYSIGTTYEDRDIWCLEISDNPGEDEGEPGIFFMGLHHAREWPTVEICLNIADELTSEYGSDPDITDIIDNNRIWLVTCVNPDGYYYCHDLGNDWRKNRHYFPEFGTIGVDLNRNYGGSCNGDAWGAWGSVGGASVTHHSDQEVYCGPGPISEYETQAIRDVFINNDICAAITWHTHGELVLWPWAYSKYDQAPDNTYLEDVGTEIASRITRQSGSGTYTPKQGSLLYPTTGDTVDWAYGYGHYKIGRATFAYTIEACSTFHPPEGYLDQVVQENFDGALYLLQEAENIKETVTPRVIPPIIEEMTTDSDGTYTITWEEINPNAEPDYFQLDELTDMSVFTDDVESGDGAWEVDGFSISSSRSHSATSSYKSKYSHEDVSSITSKTPIHITDEMNLSFWCWYNIEEEWDYAFVEVSSDGRYFDVLDKFTGSSGDWTFKEYELNDYINESIFIRFRYTTDTNTMEEGFYVDDISPLANFDTINILSDSITDNSFEINSNEEGIYYYRVRGNNSEHGWGDFSTLESMHVIAGNNTPPQNPTIEGPLNGKIKEEQDYNIVTVDPEDNNVYYFVDWGDGTDTGWMGPYASEEEVSINHTWSKKGTFIVKVKAKDIHNLESDWTTIEVTMPLNKLGFFTWFGKVLTQYSFLFQRIINILVA